MQERPRILIVDDHPGARAIYAKLFSDAGFVIETASDGIDGIEKFEAGHFDLVITDYHMPRANGDQLIRHIQASLNPVPIILCTADPDCVSDLGCEYLAALIEKPFEQSRLIDLAQKITAPEH